MSDIFAKIRMTAGREPNGRKQRPKVQMSPYAYVYIMEATKDGAIKVGHSRDPTLRVKRVGSLSYPVCRRWQAKCLYESALLLEREFHRKFKNCHPSSLGHEWYAMPSFDAMIEIRDLAKEFGIAIEAPEMIEGTHKDQIMERRAIGSMKRRPVHLEDAEIPQVKWGRA